MLDTIFLVILRWALFWGHGIDNLTFIDTSLFVSYPHNISQLLIRKF